MRLVIARCSVDYAGRLSAHLPEATRLIMVKADGCVAIHADGGAYKPLNWMNAPNKLADNGDHWVVSNPKGETLTITLHEVITDTDHPFGDDPGLRKDGVEAHLQELLAAAPESIEPGLRLVRREYPTAIGPIVGRLMTCRRRLAAAKLVCRNHAAPASIRITPLFPFGGIDSGPVAAVVGALSVPASGTPIASSRKRCRVPPSVVK